VNDQPPELFLMAFYQDFSMVNGNFSAEPPDESKYMYSFVMIRLRLEEEEEAGRKDPVELATS
jgi:hypothetical protein